MPYIPGLSIPLSGYADVRAVGDKDPDLARQPELDWYMERYPEWRGLFEGSRLEETVSSSTDPSSDEEKNYRWPVRYNLVAAYCNLHAGMLWGRGQTSSNPNDLFTIHVDPGVPGRPGPDAKEAASKLQDIMQYFWFYQSHLLRPLASIQQWAGGTIVKMSWNPWSPSAVYGIQLETIQPEYFYPIWDPTRYEDLLAVKLKFGVPKAVAITKYGMTETDLRDYRDHDEVPVVEYWDAERYSIRVFAGRNNKNGIVARRPSDGVALEGDNPWKHPITGRGIIPFQYIPRIRVGRFMGDSLAYHLEGLQNELNKTLADYGDALTRGAHPPFGISDYTGPGSKSGTIPIPRHGALNMGLTRSVNPPKVHEFPLPKVPEQTGEFSDRLLALSESVAGLTPAARGLSEGAKSGLAIALEMLPTTNLVDWERSHWSQSIAGRGGLNEMALVIWWRKRGTNFVPAISDSMFHLRQNMEFRPVVPRDRIEIIDEVTRLVTADAISPKEWLGRLGDIEDIDEELEQLFEYLAWKAESEAAVAGRAIKVTKTENPKNAKLALPQISGQTMEPGPTQPAKQPQGMAPAKPTTSTTRSS